MSVRASNPRGRCLPPPDDIFLGVDVAVLGVEYFLGVGVLSAGDCCVEFRFFCGVVDALVVAFRLLGEGEDSAIVNDTPDELLIPNCWSAAGTKSSSSSLFSSSTSSSRAKSG